MQRLSPLLGSWRPCRSSGRSVSVLLRRSWLRVRELLVVSLGDPGVLGCGNTSSPLTCCLTSAAFDGLDVTPSTEGPQSSDVGSAICTRDRGPMVPVVRVPLKPPFLFEILWDAHRRSSSGPTGSPVTKFINLDDVPAVNGICRFFTSPKNFALFKW